MIYKLGGESFGYYRDAPMREMIARPYIQPVVLVLMALLAPDAGTMPSRRRGRRRRRRTVPLRRRRAQMECWDGLAGTQLPGLASGAGRTRAKAWMADIAHRYARLWALDSLNGNSGSTAQG